MFNFDNPTVLEAELSTKCLLFFFWIYARPQNQDEVAFCIA
jgi:hypothetical protein